MRPIFERGVGHENLISNMPLVEFFLPFVRFVASFLLKIPGGIHQQLFESKKLAVCQRKSVLLGDNSRWFAQPCVSSCLSEMTVTSKLVEKKVCGSESAEPGHQWTIGRGQPHRCGCSDDISQAVAGTIASPQRKYESDKGSVRLCNTQHNNKRLLLPCPVHLFMWKRKQNSSIFKLNFSKEQKVRRRPEARIVFVQHAEPTGPEPFFRLLYAVSVIMGYKVDVKPPSSSYCNHLMGLDLLPPCFH